MNSLVDWNSCAKKVQNMPGIVAMIKVVWKPGNSCFERKHGGDWRKLYRKELLCCYLPCLEEEIISKQMPRDGYTKKQTNTEIPAINPWTPFHTSVGTKAGPARFPQAVRAVFHFPAPLSAHRRGGWQLPCALTLAVMDGFNLWRATPALVIPAG